MKSSFTSAELEFLSPEFEAATVTITVLSKHLTNLVLSSRVQACARLQVLRMVGTVIASIILEGVTNRERMRPLKRGKKIKGEGVRKGSLRQRQAMS